MNVKMITMPSLPDTFSKNEKGQAELWGSLTNRFPVDYALIAEIDDEKSFPDGFTLKTREEISNLISQAMKAKKQRTAKTLFEITRPVTQRRDYTRKSMRIGQGEYLDLLYLKIKKDTSFSNVLIDVLTPSTIQYVENLNSKYGDTLPDQIFNLREQILKWRETAPEARSRNVGYNYIEAKENYFFPPDERDAFLENIRNATKTFGYLKNLPADIYSGPDPIYQELQDEWNKEIDNHYKTGVYREVYIDENMPNLLSFRIVIVPSVSIDSIRMEEIYQKYDYRIDEYIEKYVLDKDSEFFKKLLERYKGTPNKFTSILEHVHDISLGYEITLSKYYIEVKNKNEFEIKINMEYLKELEGMLTRSEKDILDEVKEYDYINFDDLIHKVMMSGSEIEYRLVSQLFSIGDTRYNLHTIVGYGSSLIKNEIAKYPVISYYIPHSLAPLSSIILKENNLHNLVKDLMYNN